MSQEGPDGSHLRLDCLLLPLDPCLKAAVTACVQIPRTVRYTLETIPSTRTNMLCWGARMTTGR